MQKFMRHDFHISDILGIMFVFPGKGRADHKNRPSHGLALNISPDEKTYVFLDGQVVTIGQNDIIYLPKGSSYMVYTKSSGNCYAINFELSDSVDFPPFSFRAKNAAKFINLFKNATVIWKNRETAFHMQCRSLLYQILFTMQSEYGAKYMTQSTVALIKPATEYIHNHYMDHGFSISDLAEMCGISEDYLRKIFKSFYGTSPRKYINNLKLAHAKDLVASEMYSITEAGELSGFSDMSYFCREFKKAYGVSPTEYNKKTKL